MDGYGAADWIEMSAADLVPGDVIRDENVDVPVRVVVIHREGPGPTGPGLLARLRAQREREDPGDLRQRWMRLDAQQPGRWLYVVVVRDRDGSDDQLHGIYEVTDRVMMRRRRFILKPHWPDPYDS